MNKKLSITLLVAMFSLLIIGFGGAATADAAGKCAETLLANGAGESTAFTNCRAYEADAARYEGMAAFYANEKVVSHRFVVADGSATSQPVSVDVEFLQKLALHPNYFHPGR